MRQAISDALLSVSGREDFIFLTGDLGFMALEPLRDKAGSRFLNAGVSEQNMVAVAAGLARAGFRPWVYSIAPFLYARPLEHVRNDVCLHDLPVRLVGNGGGYAYGVMGATHHALEDVGILKTLPNMEVFIPAFSADLPPMVEKLAVSPHPAYLRLGRDEKPDGFSVPKYAPWRKISSGSGPAVAAVGPLAGLYLKALAGLDATRRPALWALCEVPTGEARPPEEFLADVRSSGRLLVAEEHVAAGGIGETLARELLARGNAPKRFTHLHARGYPSKLYGSQSYHRQESGLSVEKFLQEMD